MQLEQIVRHITKHSEPSFRARCVLSYVKVERVFYNKAIAQDFLQQLTPQAFKASVLYRDGEQVRQISQFFKQLKPERAPEISEGRAR